MRSFMTTSAAAARIRPLSTLAAALLVGALAASAPRAAGAEVVETRTLDESVSVDGDMLRVVVDNVFGSIRVTGHDEPSVDLTATETIRARTQSDLERAKAEVGLRTERDDGEVAFLVRRLDDDGDCDCDGRWNRWEGFVVEYDIELRVPRDASVDLSTVNDGEIVVDGVRGDFDVANVNGPVRLGGLRGAGSARTVNGGLEASFERAPPGPTSFETVNGGIEVAFPPDLSADLEIESMHGEALTDFPVEPLAQNPVSERHGGRLVIRTARSRVRVASGGPVHSFKTLNGDIYVREVPR